ASRSRLAVAAFVAGASCAARADEDAEPSVTPYRPTVSNPADLPVPGWLELEAGAATQRDADRTRSDSAPWLLKYAVDENGGVLIGGNALVRSVDHGFRESGVGDTFVEWKQRFAVREGLAFGVEAGFESPTARSGLGVGKPAWIVNGIFSAALGASHLDVNA